MDLTRPLAALEELFPDGVAVAGAAPETLDGPLFAEEEAVIERARGKRRAEFRAGRVLARRLLPAVGCGEVAVPADGRRPVWPDGVLGSITHTQGICAVAVAARNGLRGVGLDIERAGAVEEKLFRRILGPEEEAWVAARPEPPEHWGTVLFSAKESFYKSLADIHPHFVGFHDVRVELDADARTFTVVPLADEVVSALQTVDAPVRGVFRHAADWVITGLVLNATG